MYAKTSESVSTSYSMLPPVPFARDTFDFESGGIRSVETLRFSQITPSAPLDFARDPLISSSDDTSYGINSLLSSIAVLSSRSPITAPVSRSSEA